MEAVWLQLQNKLIVEYNSLIQKLEKKYMNYIQELLTQKTQILIGLQKSFYNELNKLNKISKKQNNIKF